MRFFTDADISRAAEAMVYHIDYLDKALLGIMSGIKRRARARAILAFAQQLAPPPPDYSITTMRMVLGRLFGRSISNNDLHKHFATPGRRADDRVDLEQLETWYDQHVEVFSEQATALILSIDEEWRTFTRLAAHRAADLRREIRKEEHQAPTDEV